MMKISKMVLSLLFSYALFAGHPDGDLQMGHPLELSFHGPYAKEMDVEPNPFLDYRLQVYFTSPTGMRYNVPGFFNGDGNGDGDGEIWSVRFTPDQAGEWTYLAQLRTGKNIAVDLSPGAGATVKLKKAAGAFTVQPCSPGSPDFYKWGRLMYTGGHYLKFAEGPYWIKGGTDSPEDFLSYVDFDNTPNPKHRYASHVKDWHTGDPVWNGDKGKAIIGALNYLSLQHVNSIYFLVQNIGGDGKNVWPFAGDIDPNGHPDNDNLHYDISKLHQWNVVFTHAQQKGIMLHFVLNEAEVNNKRELDNGELGVERKLFYREMVARFGHHNAVQWNISEEYDLFFDLTPKRVLEFAGYIGDVDPYDHPVTVHNEGRDPDPGWLPFLGEKSLTSTSFQFYQSTAKWGERVEKWRRLTLVAGHPLPINLDEILPLGVDNQERLRKEVLWPTFLSGGSIEYIHEEMLNVEDFRRVEKMWQWTWYARRFMHEHLPFREMVPDDLSLVKATNELGGAQVLAKPGEIYAIYLPVAEPSGELTMWRIEGKFEQRWFNPRTGVFEGPVIKFESDSTVPLGAPPKDAGQDWVVLIRRM